MELMIRTEMELITKTEMVCEMSVCTPFNHLKQLPAGEYFIEFNRSGSLKLYISHNIVTRYVTTDVSCNIGR